MTGIGKMSESEVDSSLEYNNNNSISNNDAFEKYNDDRRIQDSCSISRREPEGKDNDSIVASSLTNDANNKLLPLGETGVLIVFRTNIIIYFHRIRLFQLNTY